MKEALDVVEKLLQEHKDILNDRGMEEYTHLASLYGGTWINFAEDIENMEIDSDDFNVGFETGYMYALNTVIRELNGDKTRKAGE